MHPNNDKKGAATASVAPTVRVATPLYCTIPRKTGSVCLHHVNKCREPSVYMCVMCVSLQRTRTIAAWHETAATCSRQHVMLMSRDGIAARWSTTLAHIISHPDSVDQQQTCIVPFDMSARRWLTRVSETLLAYRHRRIMLPAEACPRDATTIPPLLYDCTAWRNKGETSRAKPQATSEESGPLHTVRRLVQQHSSCAD